jgi:methionine-gamma-lyase
MTDSSDQRASRRRFEPLPEWVGPTTRLVHGVRRPDYNAGSVVPPIYQTSTFHWPQDRSEASVHGEAYLYTRNENPTNEEPAELVRQLEGGESARFFASGMGAISAAVLSLLSTGDEVAAPKSLYGATTALLTELLPRYGIRVRQLSDAEARAPETYLTRDTRLAVVESPTNPTLRVYDLARWADAAHRVGAVVLVDNTFASPINQRPIELGADLVAHSATKYLGGHSDLIGGVLVGRGSLLARTDAKGLLGASPDPFAAFLLTRGLRTLALRVARQNENGRRVAEAARGHPAVRAVHYPGWAGPEEEEIAARQMSGRGGVLALSLAGGPPAADSFVAKLRLVHAAASLGGVESLVSIPQQTSHRHMSDSELAHAGIDAGCVRLALGIEDTEDLIRDIRGALDASR